ncbi:MAG: chaperone modulator CbpM [Chloroflexota bacterium]|nr:hypothetical protein [Chloroflexota bacterium]
MSNFDLHNEKSLEDGYYQYKGITYYSLEITTSKTRLGRTIVERCVSYGIVTPVPQLEIAAPDEGPFYSEADLLRLRRVRRLIDELGLNWAGVEVVMRLTDRLEQLQNEVTRLRH